MEFFLNLLKQRHQIAQILIKMAYSQAETMRHAQNLLYFQWRMRSKSKSLFHFFDSSPKLHKRLPRSKNCFFSNTLRVSGSKLLRSRNNLEPAEFSAKMQTTCGSNGPQQVQTPVASLYATCLCKPKPAYQAGLSLKDRAKCKQLVGQICAQWTSASLNSCGILVCHMSM